MIPSPLCRASGTAARRPSRLPHQSPDPFRREALLVAAKTSGRVAEGAGDLGLRRVLRFPQRDHRIRFRSLVLHAVVSEDDTMHGDHSLGSLGPERHPVIDIDRAAWRKRARQKYFLLRRRRWPSCQIRWPPRSGRVLVRTHCQGWGRKLLSLIPRLTAWKPTAARFRPQSALLPVRKNGQVLVRTLSQAWGRNLLSLIPWLNA